MREQRRRPSCSAPSRSAHLNTSIIVQVCAADRRYFEQHPHKTTYTRAYVAGEALRPARSVVVTRIRPGVRTRLFVDATGLARQGVTDFDYQSTGAQR